MLLTGIRQAHHHIRLNVSLQSDLLWWCTFMESWSKGYPLSATEMWTDASGSWIWGDLTAIISLDTIAMFLLQPCRFQPKEPEHIMERAVLVCVVWLKQWQGLSVSVHCDNMGVVVVFNTEYNCEQPIMHLLWCLFFIRATNQFSVCTTHTSGG